MKITLQEEKEVMAVINAVRDTKEPKETWKGCILFLHGMKAQKEIEEFEKQTA